MLETCRGEYSFMNK